MIYECHITISLEHAKKAMPVAKELHWKTSEIARDPILGNKTFFYLTTHSESLPGIASRMERCSRELEVAGVPIIREKIELILHDTKAKL